MSSAERVSPEVQFEEDAEWVGHSSAKGFQRRVQRTVGEDFLVSGVGVGEVGTGAGKYAIVVVDGPQRGLLLGFLQRAKFGAYEQFPGPFQ